MAERSLVSRQQKAFYEHNARSFRNWWLGSDLDFGGRADSFRREEAAWPSPLARSGSFFAPKRISTTAKIKKATSEVTQEIQNATRDDTTPRHWSNQPQPLAEKPADPAHPAAPSDQPKA